MPKKGKVWHGQNTLSAKLKTHNSHKISSFLEPFKHGFVFAKVPFFRVTFWGTRKITTPPIKNSREKPFSLIYFSKKTQHMILQCWYGFGTLLTFSLKNRICTLQIHYHCEILTWFDPKLARQDPRDNRRCAHMRPSDGTRTDTHTHRQTDITDLGSPEY